MKFLYILIFGLIINNARSQVGINTPRALANLEVHKSSLPTIPDGIIPPKTTADSLKLKDDLYGKAQDGTFIHITTPVTMSTKKTRNITSSGYYVYDANYVHKDRSKGIWKKMFSDPNVFASKGISGISLHGSGIKLLGSDFLAIQFDSAMVKEIGEEFIVGNQYIVPETGLYAISYSFRFGQGLVQQRESGKRPGVVIAKTSVSGNVPSVLDHQLLGSFQIATDKILLTEGRLNHIYDLKAGEKLDFGIITGGADVSSLGDISSEISIYKIR